MYGARQRRLEELSWKDVVVIGLAQVLALIPGTSRSGITISAGLMMGLTREAAARFSFLMAIPVIALAGIWQAKGLNGSDSEVSLLQLLVAVGLAAFVAFLSIHFFLGLVQRYSLWPFVIYRLVLGVILLIVFM